MYLTEIVIIFKQETGTVKSYMIPNKSYDLTV